MNDIGNLTLSGGNISSSQMKVQLYAVAWSGLLALALIIFGILPNCALLVAMRCKRQLQSWNSALIYNICVCNIAFCLLWTPLNFGLAISGYYQSGVNFVACYLHLALFHFFVAEIATSTLLLGVQRMCAVWSVRLSRNNNVLVMTAIVFTVVVSCLCAAFVSFNHSRTYSYAACIHRFQNDAFPNEAAPLVLENNSAETVLCLIYVAASSSTSVVFFVLGLYWRRSIKTQTRSERRRHCNYQGIPSAECGVDDDRANVSVGSQASPTKSSLRDSSDMKKSSGTLSISKRVCLQEPKAEDIHAIGNRAKGGNDVVDDDDDDDDEDDDDKFDLKMRMKVSKCKRSSGRRHTVANIGTIEANFRGRRGSVDNQQGSGNQLNYQYIRKWSVDIVALQEQLENPKLHPVPLEELVSFREKTSTRGKTDAAKPSVEKKRDDTAPSRGGKEAELRMIKEQLSEEGDNAANVGEQATRTTDDGDEQIQKQSDENAGAGSPGSRPSENEATLSVCHAEEPSSSSIEVPAITIKGSSSSSGGSNNEKPNNLQADAVVQAYDIPEPTPVGGGASSRGGDAQYDVRQRLTYLWRIVVYLMTVVVCLIPLCVFLAVTDDSVSVRYVLMTVVLFQCPIQPLFIIWSDPVVEQAVHRLKLKMLSLRCVCYCNIGKGKRCLGRPPEYQ